MFFTLEQLQLEYCNLRLVQIATVPIYHTFICRNCLFRVVDGTYSTIWEITKQLEVYLFAFWRGRLPMPVCLGEGTCFREVFPDTKRTTTF